MSSHTLLRTALKFAANKHSGQVRKGTKLPYLIHPIEVAMTLTTLHCQTEIIIAGYLHDTLEDTDTTFEEIETIFGNRVAKIVQEVTEVNKEKAFIKAESYSADAIMVKTADLICNINDIYDDYQIIGDEVFKLFANGKKTLTHYKKMINLLIKKTKFNPRFNRALVELLTKIDLMS